MENENMATALTPLTAIVPDAVVAPLDFAETQDRIKILHNQVVEGLRRTTPTIIALGNELLAVKAQLPHGEFMKWFGNANFNFKARTARLYMGLAAAAANPKMACLATMEPYEALKKAKLISVKPISRKAKDETDGEEIINRDAPQSAERPTPQPAFKIGEISVEDTGESLIWNLTADWRNALANALADERAFERALQRGLLLKLEPQP